MSTDPELRAAVLGHVRRVNLKLRQMAAAAAIDPATDAEAAEYLGVCSTFDWLTWVGSIHLYRSFPLESAQFTYDEAAS